MSEMLGRLIPLVPVLALQGVGVFVLFKFAGEPSRYGFILCGGVVGWLLFYFVRRFSVFSPKTLTATLAAFLGGEGLSWLAAIRTTRPDVDAEYFAGLGIGFFLFLIYSSFCAWMFAMRIVDSPLKLESLIGCGAHSSKDLEEIEEIIRFEEKARSWSEGEISKEAFQRFVRTMTVSRDKLLSSIEETDQELIDRLRKEQLLPSPVQK